MQIAEVESEIIFCFKDMMVKIIVYTGSIVSMLIFYLYLCQLDLQYGEEHIGFCLQDYFSNYVRIYFPKFCYWFSSTSKHLLLLFQYAFCFLKKKKKRLP